MTKVTLNEISVSYSLTPVLNSINLEILPGEIFFLLGPSGCGKSTLLRTIAGLLKANKGKIFFDDEDITKLPPEKRNTAMVFQNYALWPHMTVLENLKFALSIKKKSKKEVEYLALETLELVGMKEFADRKPGELSGGQQQRTALARAIVVKPRILLLDEPLSNLDAKLRIQMRNEIRKICKTCGLTTIYVTHDQKEALSMADRIAILHNGNLQQVGSPFELYYHPNNTFIAGFLGETNFIPAKIMNITENFAATVSEIGELKAYISPSISLKTSDSCILSIRPESIKILDKKMENSFLA
ncbi:MAG TPA: ABC transporter ATP-binding protein [Victivallales bacterium]|nr:ABC transporter ATP-binding protein [Victivallales bacterium]